MTLDARWMLRPHLPFSEGLALSRLLVASMEGLIYALPDVHIGKPFEFYEHAESMRQVQLGTTELGDKAGVATLRKLVALLGEYDLEAYPNEVHIRGFYRGLAVYSGAPYEVVKEALGVDVPRPAKPETVSA